ncbi:hypothetical protein NDU88_003149 [Pleurodeles waltl]|uniref:Uncharacterized protein n=1 Tax=Pleurodeles waltl TaxID=8319 RepID=A0AAV7UBB1_PLEWA|nr:hypothetical protein NDU88_003149 [Pleurodeles waltl]
MGQGRHVLLPHRPQESPSVKGQERVCMRSKEWRPEESGIGQWNLPKERDRFRRACLMIAPVNPCSARQRARRQGESRHEQEQNDIGFSGGKELDYNDDGTREGNMEIREDE